MNSRSLFTMLLVVLLCSLLASPSAARNSIRRAFFNVYPDAETSRLADLPSNANHCGVCHFNFDGGGARNPYGLAIEVARNSGMYPDDETAILSLDGDDSDNDDFGNGVEITDTANFSNTPTFPGLKLSNVSQVLNVDVDDLLDYLTPSGSDDTTPPTVIVSSPNGGESYAATSTQTVSWTATDESGISGVTIYMSDDGGASFKTVARGLANSGSYSWFVPNLPGTATRIKVEARDGAGNKGEDASDGNFDIEPVTGGVIPTTLRDFELAGTQPLEGGTLEDPNGCATCHGNYDQIVEPWHNWLGSMMGQAMRDPLFTATMVIAEQDAPGVGDLCLRCHTPGGWQAGRSTDTSGGMINELDRMSVQCDFCHRQVDPIFQPGVSPPVDEEILDELAELPLAYANGQFVTDPDPVRRGPYADAAASHQFLESPFHRSSDLCGTCHDVSNPAFVMGSSPDEYVPNDFDTAHPDGDLRNMFPVERTYSEWSISEYATTGVYAPQFAGNLPGGVVSTCQDCHMKDVTGAGANEPGSPVRTDLPLHDMMGGNYFVGDILPDFYPTEVDVAALQDGKARALHMLSLAATLELASSSGGGHPVLSVTVTNQTGHKLPSGYPEGRRMWLNVRAYDTLGELVYESGAYDLATGVLTHDPDLKIYEVKPGISTRLADIVGAEAGPSFHFVLNDSIYKDNRIPPRGVTNAALVSVQSPVVAYSYPDGQYWDVTTYDLPASAREAEVVLYYQTTSKEYIEFLRDANETDNQGQDLYDAWVNQGRAAPVAMVDDLILLDASAQADAPTPVTRLTQNYPNPFNPVTKIRYAVARAGRVSLLIYDERGRLVCTLVDAEMPAGDHEVSWRGSDNHGRRVASGVYHYVLTVGEVQLQRKMTLIK